MNSFHTATQSDSTNDEVGVDEKPPVWIEDIDDVTDSEPLHERPEDLDPKYKAYLEDQQESEDEDDGEGASAKRKRTAGVSQGPTIYF
jgi:hypothetical protein